MVFSFALPRDVEPIPFVAARRPRHHATDAATAPQHKLAVGYAAVYPPSPLDAYATPPPVEAFHGAPYAATPPPRVADAAASMTHWPPRGLALEFEANSNAEMAAVSPFTIGVDAVQVEPMESNATAAPVKKARAPRAKAAAVGGPRTRKKRTTATVASSLDLQAEKEEALQAKRKSEIEKKSRMKRASNIDSMKDRVAQLEQSLMRLTDQFDRHGIDDNNDRHHLRYAQFTHDPHYPQLSLQARLVKIRELLANQFRQSVQLRNEQFQLYQQLQHYVDIKESLHNVVSAHTFKDASICDLLSWWTPPSDARCIQLARESIAKIRAFGFSKRHVTDFHAGWTLSYEHSAHEGCKFNIARNMSMIDAAALAQTCWDARSSTEGASRLAATVCKAEATIIKAVNKDMVIVNRTLQFPQFTIHTLYLLFRMEVDGTMYVVSRELGRSQAMKWDQRTRDFPETSAETWVDLFTWSSFTKIPYDPEAPVSGCPEYTEANGPDGMAHSYRVDYGGWWGTSYALGIQRWLLEMLFMVVRWESLYIQPRLLTA